MYKIVIEQVNKLIIFHNMVYRQRVMYISFSNASSSNPVLRTHSDRPMTTNL